jgi:hypothetical protein
VVSLTIFSAPKPFTDPHIRTIQRNAIQSWLRLPDVQVILVGEEEGLAETAAEFGLLHVPHVRRNRHGTPLVSSIFEQAREAASAPLLAYVNADILLFADFLQAAEAAAAQAGRFLLVGQRWDLDVTEPLDFSSETWAEALRQRAQRDGTLHPPAGSDYFAFPHDLFRDMPDFAIGRAGWDNWMIYKARREGWPVIDGTPSVFIIHQNHDYSHLPGGTPHYKQPETFENIRLAGGRAVTRFTLADVTHRLTKEGLRPAPLTRRRFLRAVETAALFYLGNAWAERVHVRLQRWSK